MPPVLQTPRTWSVDHLDAPDEGERTCREQLVNTATAVASNASMIRAKVSTRIIRLVAPTATGSSDVRRQGASPGGTNVPKRVRRAVFR